jgi:hypothetical protein
MCHQRAFVYFRPRRHLDRPTRALFQKASGQSQRRVADTTFVTACLQAAKVDEAWRRRSTPIDASCDSVCRHAGQDGPFVRDVAPYSSLVDA